jgi:hypothetical protein
VRHTAPWILLSLLLTAAPSSAANCLSKATKIACGQTIHGSITDDDCNPFSEDLGDRQEWFYVDSQYGPRFTPTFTADFDGAFVDFMQFGSSKVGEQQVPIYIDYAVSGFAEFFPKLPTEVAGRSYFRIWGDSSNRGDYKLTLICDAGPGRPSWNPTTVRYPLPAVANSDAATFRIWVRINNKLQARAEDGDSCMAETACFSGAVAGRSEVLVRVVGPKNGHLQPSIVKFNTTRVEVWIEQVSTGLVKYYDSPAGGPGLWELKGQFDRLSGFLP